MKFVKKIAQILKSAQFLNSANIKKYPQIYKCAQVSNKLGLEQGLREGPAAEFWSSEKFLLESQLAAKISIFACMLQREREREKERERG